VVLAVKFHDAAARVRRLISRIRSEGPASSIATLEIPKASADRFLIFSLPRSGSSTLRDILQCHPQVRCAFEPFNSDTDLGKIYGRGIVNRATLEAALSELWKKHNGIKHVWNRFGYPFEKSPDKQLLNHHLLEVCNAKVIFLKRRNALKRIVSDELSHQSRVWRSSAGARKAHLRYDFRPLDIKRIQSSLRQEFEALASYRESLVYRRVPFIDLWYEDLYGEEESLKTGPAKIREIISFLGLSQFEERNWARVISLLDPLQTKVNSRETYLRIPNIDEVERVLGSEETGWLFRRV
jgi:sulfotransferase family protein